MIRFAAWIIVFYQLHASFFDSHQWAVRAQSPALYEALQQDRMFLDLHLEDRQRIRRDEEPDGSGEEISFPDQTATSEEEQQDGVENEAETEDPIVEEFSSGESDPTEELDEANGDLEDEVVVSYTPESQLAPPAEQEKPVEDSSDDEEDKEEEEVEKEEEEDHVVPEEELSIHESQIHQLLQLDSETALPAEGCAATAFGCCPDHQTPAHGERMQGCCLNSNFSCCHHDFITPAAGKDQDGCDCNNSEFGCCPDSTKSALGPNNKGCGCSYSEFGCCPDQVSFASGPEFAGCECFTYDFGCCPDGVTVAQGPKMEGCPGCEATQFGCCPDKVSPAAGPDGEGCGCEASEFGCCPDGSKTATGPDFQDCEDVPGAACFLDKDPGQCRENFTVVWFFDSEYGGCSRFWYSPCPEDNTASSKKANRFLNQAQCESMCVKPPGSGRCYLPKVKGPCDQELQQWYFDRQWNKCMPFAYGGCLGNSNRFVNEQECQESCIHSHQVAVCSQSVEPGPCRGEFARYYYDDQSGQCKVFNYTGCLGNDNRFLTKESCENTCKHNAILTLAKARCSLPKKEGHCNQTLAKWYHDSKIKTCRPFYYSGCDGNDNQFDSLQQCQESCPNAFPPEIDVLTKLVVVEEENEAVLQVKVQANPPPAVKWLFEDREVEYSDRIAKGDHGSLIISPARRSDSGLWTIVADNKLGQVARKQISLKVHPNKMPVQVFVPKEKDRFVFSKDIVLSCQVRGYPIPEIRWFKNNSPLPKSARISILDDHSLVISKASVIDGGTYTCRASNEHETASDRIVIKVEKPDSDQKVCLDKPKYARCDLVVKAKACNKNPFYADFCCKSCTQAGQLQPR